MITELLMMGMGLGIFVLTVIIAIWWRSHWRYVYFGGPGSVINSWLGTLVGSFFAASLIIGMIGTPITWLHEHCPHLLDIVAVVVGVYCFSNRGKDTTSEEAENKSEN